MPKTNKHTATAIEKLNRSKLANAHQMELLGGDVDLDAFHLQLRGGTGLDIVNAIQDAIVDRTVDGASTITVTVVDDDDRGIQRSGKLVRQVDVNVDGLWWTLVAVSKKGLILTLTFEEREVNVLRRYNKPLFADRNKVTRAEFVLRMIREVRETHLKWVIPELHIKQPISDVQPGTVLINGSGDPTATAKQVGDFVTARQQRGKGISPGSGLTVKGSPASREQINNANTILEVAEALHAPRNVMVCSIMTAITESTIHNLTGGDRDSVGVFQQRKSQGWPATRNVSTDAAAFIRAAISINQRDPGLPDGVLCQQVQHSADASGSNYAQYQDEGEAFVNAFNRAPNKAEAAAIGAGSQTSATTSMFVRGTITKAKGMTGSYLLTPENSWNCMQRLAQEVNWRAFCVSGTIYFISERWLFQSKPFMTISEDTIGIDWIDYDFDEGKHKGTLSVTAHMGRWAAPPGSVVEIKNMGVIDGKYLVNDVQRSLYNEIGTITLEKPLPILPEPVALSGIPSGFGSSPTPKTGDGGISLVQGNKMQQTVVAYAQSQLGVPYAWGAEQKGIAFDCSGLAQAAYDSAGLSPQLPRVAQGQYDYGKKLSRADKLEPGDLVFFGSGVTSIEHVGIYVGNGAMIDAPHTGARVRIDKNFLNWTNPAFVGATRPWMK